MSQRLEIRYTKICELGATQSKMEVILCVTKKNIFLKNLITIGWPPTREMFSTGMLMMMAMIYFNMQSFKCQIISKKKNILSILNTELNAEQHHTPYIESRSKCYQCYDIAVILVVIWYISDFCSDITCSDISCDVVQEDCPRSSDFAW